MSTRIVNPDTGHMVFPRSTVEVVPASELGVWLPPGHVAVRVTPGTGAWGHASDVATYPQSWVVDEPDCTEPYESP
jgi:hypothetical protein